MKNLPARIALVAAGFLVALFGVGGVGAFLCVALYVFLCRTISPELAALAAAGILLAATFLFIWVFGTIAGGLNRKTEDEDEPTRTFGAEVGRLLGENTFAVITRNPLQILVLAVCAGFAIGFSAKFRAFLLKLIRG
jgi:hypothetical protein